MNKDYFNRKIAEHPIVMNEEKKRRVIQIGKKQIEERQLLHFSLYNLFTTTIRFIRLRNWFFQFLSFLLGVYALYSFSGDYNKLSSAISSLTIIVLFSALFVSDEIFKSFTSGMWELEQTLKYDLRQHVLVKFIIMGTAEMLLVVSLALFSQRLLSIAFWRIAIYILVPFNLFCILAFSLLTILRNKMKNVILWFASGVLISLFWIACSLYDIYQISMEIWSVAYCLTVIVFFTILYEI